MNVEQIIRADMLKAKADYQRHYQSHYPGSANFDEHWEVALFAAWSAAARDAEAWREKAMILTVVAAGLCLWIVWKL